MKTTTRFFLSGAAACSVVFMCLMTVSYSSTAQIFSISDKYYKGFDVSFGQYTFRSESNFKEIDRARVTLAGGEAGLVFGSKSWRTVACIIGYYSSVSDIAGTIDLYRHSISTNFYPLTFITEKKLIIDPYVSAGLTYNRFKLYGEYTDDDFSPEIVIVERYLGNMKQVNGTLATGFEIKLLEDLDFVHVFTEAVYAANLSNTFEPPDFRNTTVTNQWMFNLGVRYGAAPKK